MLILKLLQPDVGLVVVVIELPVPSPDELLQLLLSDVDVFLELLLLDVGPQLVLVGVDVSLKQSHFSHQILVQLVLLDMAELLSQDVHLFLDGGKNEDLLILIQLAISTLVKHIEELLWSLESQEVVDLKHVLVGLIVTYLMLLCLVDQSDIGLIENAFFSEVCLSHGLPDLLALPSSTNQRPRLLNKLHDSSFGVVGESGKGCVSMSTRHAREGTERSF